MTASMGRITARLAEPNEHVPADLVSLINRNVKPPEPVGAEDVHIRSMYIVSDQVNSFGGRFPEEEHQRLAELLIDSPVMVGHRKDKLPVGRNFHAVKTVRDGHPWVRSYFYWLRSSQGSAALAENIDGGIYKECSVAFTFSLPECSICGKDIRLCPHQPLEKYSKQGRREVCHFNYRQIERVLETSLVYRGAIPKTSMSKELLAGACPPGLPVPGEIADLRALSPSCRYLIIPRYDAIEALAGLNNGRLVFVSLDGAPLGDHGGYTYQPTDFRPEGKVRGLLVGYRGKDRCDASQTAAFIERQAGPVSRLVFNVLPHQGINTIAETGDRTGLDIRLIPYREASLEEINRKALEIMTRAGVELWPADEDLAGCARFVYRPRPPESPSQACYTLDVCKATRGARLTLHPQNQKTCEKFFLPCFDGRRLDSGRKFVAWPAENIDSADSSGPVDPGDNVLLSLSRTAGVLSFEAQGYLQGRFVLRPMRLGGRRGCLFGRFRGAA